MNTELQASSKVSALVCIAASSPPTQADTPGFGQILYHSGHKYVCLYLFGAGCANVRDNIKELTDGQTNMI
jgi:hypothetical protein